MISGAGATLAEYYGINPYVGRVGMTLAAFFTVILGLHKLTDILGSLGTVIIVFSVGVGLISFLGNAGGLVMPQKLFLHWKLQRTAAAGSSPVSCILVLMPLPY